MHSAEATKHCKDCNSNKPPEEFYMDRCRPDGRQTYCKTCQKERMRHPKSLIQRLFEDMKNEESDSSAGTTEGSDALSADTQIASDLYVMRNARIEGEYKVGRSRDVEQRRAHLQSSQNFRVQLIATFPQGGWAEAAVHARLAYARVHSVPGREWFKAGLNEVLFAIATALASGTGGI